MAGKNTVSGPIKKHWGFLIYIAGDNNLSDAGLVDLNELCKEGISDDIHCGVEIDTYGEHTGSIRYEITPRDWTDQAYRTVIQRLPEKDTGDPETLRSFLQWGLERYPAENLLLVVWNHGTGFRSIRRNIGYDDFGTSLDMPEIEAAFHRSGIGPDNRIAILGFDACLMNMLEIVHHFKDHAEIVVGSQQTEPGDGWPYDKVLAAMKTTDDKIDMAKRIVQLYIDDYKSKGIYNVTQSAVETQKTEAAVNALSRLGHLLAANYDHYKQEIKEARMSTQAFEMSDYIDLIHMGTLFSTHIKNETIARAARTIVNTATACTLVSQSLGYAVKEASGLSVWFPTDKSLYHNYRPKYLSLKCNTDDPGWVKFLDVYHSE